MNDKQQLAAIGNELRLTEEQTKALAERMPQTGSLQILGDEPLCMAKRIEELEAQVRALTAPEDWQLVPHMPTPEMCEAFHKSDADWEDGWAFDDNGNRHESPVYQWVAMLAAAPKPECAA